VNDEPPLPLLQLLNDLFLRCTFLVRTREEGGKGREGKGREGKGREGKGREGKGREGKGREGKGGKVFDNLRWMYLGVHVCM